MEASSVFHRCLWQSFSRPMRCKTIAVGSKSRLQPTRHQVTRITSRTLTSTSHCQQDAPPQPQSISRQASMNHPVSTNASRARAASRPQPDPNNRIDLSPLQRPRTANASSGSRSPNRETGSASDKLNDLFRSQQRRSPAPTEDRFQRTISQTDARNNTTLNNIDFASFLEGLDTNYKNSRPALLSDLESKLPLRLRPTLGRTMAVDSSRGVDLTRAFRFLEQKCSANNVKRDAMGQRFHVRRGQKKKSLRSLRWRNAFKAGFLEECARVRRMKNQGW